MKAFIDAEVSKKTLLETLARHRVEDRIMQGWHYWRGGRGCAVGCTLHEFAPGEEGNHTLYEDLFGIPRELAHLEDAIFEGLDVESAGDWPERFVEAVPEGADLTDVADRIALWIIGGEDGPLAPWRDREFLQPTLDLYRQHLDGTPSRRGAWREAAGIARDGAKAADNEFDCDVGWTATHGHVDGEYFELVRGSTVIAGCFSEQSRPAGASLASARLTAERARTEACGRIADKLIELLKAAEVAPARGE